MRAGLMEGAYLCRTLRRPADAAQEAPADDAGEGLDDPPVEEELSTRGVAEAEDPRLRRKAGQAGSVLLDEEVPGRLREARFAEALELGGGNGAEVAFRPPEPSDETEDELAARVFTEGREAEAGEGFRQGPSLRDPPAPATARITAKRHEHARRKRPAEIVAEDLVENRPARRPDLDRVTLRDVELGEPPVEEHRSETKTRESLQSGSPEPGPPWRRARRGTRSISSSSGCGGSRA